MASRKLLTYVLIVSRVFPAYHPRKGERTWFPEKVYQATVQDPEEFYSDEYKKAFGVTAPTPKLHTVRFGFQTWKKRIDEVNAGTACLDIRTWSGAPYRTPQLDVVCLMKAKDQPDCGLTVSKCDIDIFQVHAKPLPVMGLKGGTSLMMGTIKVDGKEIQQYRDFYANDGLFDNGDAQDFMHWFGHGEHRDMALIQWAPHKY